MTMDLMLDFLLRLFVAGAMGAIIGLEREYRERKPVPDHIFWWQKAVR